MAPLHTQPAPDISGLLSLHREGGETRRRGKGVPRTTSEQAARLLLPPCGCGPRERPSRPHRCPACSRFLRHPGPTMEDALCPRLRRRADAPPEPRGPPSQTLRPRCAPRRRPWPLLQYGLQERDPFGGQFTESSTAAFSVEHEDKMYGPPPLGPGKGGGAVGCAGGGGAGARGCRTCPS